MDLRCYFLSNAYNKVMYKNPDQLHKEHVSRQLQKTVAHNSKEVRVGIYLVKCGDLPYYKVGISRDITMRVKALQACCPLLLTCLHYSEKFNRITAEDIEARIHQTYADFNIRGEWFEFSDKQVSAVIQDIVWL